VTGEWSRRLKFHGAYPTGYLVRIAADGCAPRSAETSGTLAVRRIALVE
jgi:hypothetical protein